MTPLCVLCVAGLRELRVDGCGHALTDEGWARFASHHPHLTKFDLTSCLGVTSAGLIRSLPCLQHCLVHVALTGCTGVLGRGAPGYGWLVVAVLQNSHELLH